MAAPLKAGIAPDLDLADGYVIQFTALDPSTGLVVSGVTVSNTSILVSNVVGGDLTDTGPDSVPLWVPIPNDEVAS